jgi:hypothetical protein
MAIFKTLSNPTVRINNVNVLPKANSVTVKLGKGEKSVVGVSAGGLDSSQVVSENVETRCGEIKMSFHSTIENYENLRTWLSIDLNVGNTISVTEDDFHAVMTGGIIINDPEVPLGNEETFEVHFKGSEIA